MNIIDKILSSELFANNPPVLLDIGASGEIHSKWKPIAQYAVCIAFDADDREMGYTVNETGGYRKLFVFSKLVTDNTNPEADFFLTKSPYCSSLLYPDHKNINNWNFGELFDVEKTVRMKTAYLPALLAEIGISKIDWFKTDSQGTDLRLFKSLGEDKTDNVLVAEFEPGIIDGYIGEDKLWHIISFMEKRPFWMSDIKICGTQRISKRTVTEKFRDFGGKIPPEMLFKTSPGWGEVTFFNTFDPRSTSLDVRDHLLGWIFAIIEEQFGFAMDIAIAGYDKFSDPFFQKLSNCAQDIITRRHSPDAALALYSDEEPQRPVTVTYMRRAAEKLIETNNIMDAFQLLVQAKSLRQLQGVDYLRAVCFLHMQKPGEAVVALREELRYFPENIEARNLYNKIAPDQMAATHIIDEEFLELYKIIEPFSMLGVERLYSLYLRARTVCEKDIPGNFVECGVAAGGSSALLAYIIKKYSKRERYLFAFDSFAGLPAPSSADSHNGLNAVEMGWGAGTCSAPESSVLTLCMRLGALPIIKTVKGFYEETLPHFKKIVGPIAFMHMDADWYESIMTILVNMYDQLADGALVQVDDYGYWEGCKKAFDDFLNSRGSKLEMHDIDSCAVWFQKTGHSSMSPEEKNEIRCPISGSLNVVFERSINAGQLVDAYKSTLGIDVSRYFKTAGEIHIYRSLDTGYRFYYPYNVAGDSSLYEELQALPWYYMDWKWEHDMALERIKPSEVVLEIGCGKGGFLEKTQQKGINCFGLEMNRDAMRAAQERGLSVCGESIQVHMAKNRNRYDLVCVFQVLEHISEVGEFLSSCLEVLKPGGRLILSVPNNDALMFRLPEMLPINAPPHHMGLWGINALLSLTKFFPLRLDTLEHEPLQSYHVDFSKQVIKEKLFKKEGGTREALFGCETLISEVMELILENIPGHTVMAYYTKL
ncbi:MAG: class I SAM-dependent methyltransferase [Desulfuromonadaceae bacterium]|nr:class I SAM-dependent methyltransferase [Desulfuromonadaceae bacterium]